MARAQGPGTYRPTWGNQQPEPLAASKHHTISTIKQLHSRLANPHKVHTEPLLQAAPKYPVALVNFPTPHASTCTHPKPTPSGLLPSPASALLLSASWHQLRCSRHPPIGRI
eukprot:scaffold11070_cov92-Isochrysis_galbana.AAC.1